MKEKSREIVYYEIVDSFLSTGLSKRLRKMQELNEILEYIFIHNGKDFQHILNYFSQDWKIRKSYHYKYINKVTSQGKETQFRILNKIAIRELS